MCKHAVQKLPYLLRYVADKVSLENSRTLKWVPDCYKNQEMCNKTVDNYPIALDFVPESFMRQKT